MHRCWHCGAWSRKIILLSVYGLMHKYMTTMSDNTEECIARIQAAGLNGNSEIQINLDQIYTCS